MTDEQIQRMNMSTERLIKDMSCKHHRLHSWKHCRMRFLKLLNQDRRDEQSLDEATVHLAYYLASYGMYRGSSQLLKKTYTILMPVMDSLLKSPYVEAGAASNSVVDAFTSERAKMAWEHHNSLVVTLKSAGIDQTSMGTLTTKILLGTWCSVPAFDERLKATIKSEKIAKATLSKRNIDRLYSFVRDNAQLFQRQVDSMRAAGHDLPAIRVVDMVLWEISEKP